MNSQNPDDLDITQISNEDLVKSQNSDLIPNAVWYLIPKKFYELLHRHINASPDKILSKEIFVKKNLETSLKKLNCSSLLDSPSTEDANNNNTAASATSRTPVYRLNKELTEGEDFVFVTHELFQKIEFVVGVEDLERDRISRSVIVDSGRTKCIDLHPHYMECRLLVKSKAHANKWEEDDSPIPFTISKAAKVCDLYNKVKSLYADSEQKNSDQEVSPNSIPNPPALESIASDNPLLYFRYKSKDKTNNYWKYTKITERYSSPKIIADVGLDNGATIIVDKRKGFRIDTSILGHVTVLNSVSSMTSTSSGKPFTFGNNNSKQPQSIFNDPKRNSSVIPGQVGLDNLGNTCFMASGLQCISNVPVLTEFFLSRNWVVDINADNPIGAGGRLAEEYYRLLTNLWDSSESSVAPRAFKMMIGKWNSRFVGYQQQDSHEFIGALIDGIHEDLNRIRKKPYVEIKELFMKA